MGEQAEVGHGRHLVLIVDDDEQLAKSLKDILSLDGHDTIVAHSGKEALARLEERLPCMALLDVAMPGMGGLTLCKHMKQNPRTEDIPVAFVTGQVEAEDVDAGLAAGAVDYIKKPFDIDEIRVRVRVQIRLHETLRTQRQIERHLSMVSNAAKDAVIIINNAGAVTNWNQASVAMFGYGETEAIGKNLHDLIAPQRFHSAHLAAFAQFRTTGQGDAIGRTLELEARRKTGEEFPVELSLSAANIDGEWCAIGIVRDISDRKLFQSALKQSEREYRMLYEASQDALMTLAPPSWRFLSCNEATLRLFAATSESEFVKLGPWNVSPETQPDGSSSGPAAQQMIEKAMKEGVAKFVWVHKRLNEEEFPCEILLTRMAHGDQPFLQATVRDISESIRASEALQVSEARYRASFENASVGQTLVTKDGHLVEVNNALANMLGYNEAELRGKSFVELTYPEDRKESIEAVASLRAGQPLGRLEKRYSRKDGSVLWADVNLAALRNAEGEVINFVVHVSDISERKRIEAKLAQDEEALRRSERFARSTVDALSANIAILDESGSIITVNAAWRTFADANPPISTNVNEGANYIAVCDRAEGRDSEGAATFADGIRSVLRGDIETFEQEYPCSSPNEVRWFLGRVTRFPDAGVCRAVVAHVDITKRKVAEESTKKGAAFLNTLLDAIPIPIFHKGTDGRYIGANRAFGEFFGMGVADIIGKTVFDIVPAELAKHYERKDEDLYAKPGVQVYNAEARNGQGELREVVFHKATFEDEDGFSGGIIGAILDVTDRKRAEAELGHSRKLEAVGQLAAGIAHEINTPAQYVGDGVYFMKEAFESYKPLLDKYRSATVALEHTGANLELVHEIREVESEIDLDYILTNIPGSFDRCIDGISRISSIVRAMKEFSHPDQREKSAADLNQALQNTLIIAHNEYKYVADVETALGDVPPVLCHLGDLNQVFLNLIVNAAHAIGDVIDKEREKGLIRISTLQVGDCVRIDVSDNGGGIPSEIRERIFEPFFTTKQVGKGSGQGLAIARSIVVDKHNGMLTFESHVGVGTTFTIRLPLDGKSSTCREELP